MANPPIDILDYEAERRRIQEKIRDAFSPPEISPGPSAGSPVHLILPDSPVTRLVCLGKTMGLLSHTAEGEPYVRISLSAWKPPLFLAIRSKKFRERLLALYYQQYQEGVVPELVTQAIEMLAGLAQLAPSQGRPPKKLVR